MLLEKTHLCSVWGLTFEAKSVSTKRRSRETCKKYQRDMARYHQAKVKWYDSGNGLVIGLDITHDWMSAYCAKTLKDMNMRVVDRNIDLRRYLYNRIWGCIVLRCTNFSIAVRGSQPGALAGHDCFNIVLLPGHTMAVRPASKTLTPQTSAVYSSIRVSIILPQPAAS